MRTQIFHGQYLLWQTSYAQAVFPTILRLCFYKNDTAGQKLRGIVFRYSFRDRRNIDSFPAAISSAGKA